MTLAEKINQDMLSSMRSGDTDRVAVLRLVKSSLKNEQIKLGHELSDDETLKVLMRELKQRRDSVDAYTSANRKDLADAESAEMVIIAEYLPTQLDETEVTKLVEQAIADTGAESVAQMGAVIGKVMAAANGQVDGSMVARIAKEKLG